MNCYAWLDDVKGRLGISGSSDDSDLLSVLHQASRDVDHWCYRHFYIMEGQTRFFDGNGNGVQLCLDDFLSISAFTADSEKDGTYDGETWVENTDFYVFPAQGFPKIGVEKTGFGNFSFNLSARRFYKVTGNFGYGDGVSATPYKDSGTTLNGAINASVTTVTVNDGTKFQVGQTLRINSEQMFVEAISTNDLTVVRGVNNSTAASHSDSDAVSIYQYPEHVVSAVWDLVERQWSARGRIGIKSYKAGDYSESYFGPGGGTQAVIEGTATAEQMNRMLGSVMLVAA